MVLFVEQAWLERRFHDDGKIVKPEELEELIVRAPGVPDSKILDRVWGSMMGLVIGDALGASVEFRPRSYLLENPVKDFQNGGTWGLHKGQVRCFVFYLFCLQPNPLVHGRYLHGSVPG